MSIKVAVRLRPFNKRELDMQSSNVVEMEGQKTILTQLESGKKREFNFDYSLWSFDGFDVQLWSSSPTVAARIPRRRSA